MTIALIEEIASITGESADDLQAVHERYPVAVTPFLMKRIREGTYSDQAFRQFLPDSRELEEHVGFDADPTGEQHLHPSSAILQTYENRLAITLTNHCLAYCRFCFRKAKVGPDAEPISEQALDKAIAFITEHPEIEDVLLTGGDPLALPNKIFFRFCDKLVAISHVQAIRIDSRALSLHPARIDDELLAYLKVAGKFWFYAHLNHPDDVNHPDVIAAANRLLEAGVPIFNQSVILGGVNDDVKTMVALMKMCYFHKIIPYHIYVLDQVQGAAHFMVDNERIIELYLAIGKLSSGAKPTLVYVDKQSRKHPTVATTKQELQKFLEEREQALA